VQDGCWVVFTKQLDIKLNTANSSLIYLKFSCEMFTRRTFV